MERMGGRGRGRWVEERARDRSQAMDGEEERENGGLTGGDGGGGFRDYWVELID